MRITLAFAAVVSAFLSTGASMGTSGAAERVVINDNRTPAGSLRDGVLTIRLEVREGEWHPDGEGAPGVVIRAFAEQGKPLTVPGPMIRVPQGTVIHAYLSNTLSAPLALTGFSPRGDAANADTTQVAPGATRELRFAAGKVGTYYYRAMSGPSDTPRGTVDAELNGAFIVDSAGTPTGQRDRVFVIGLWSAAPLPGGVVARTSLLRFTINGTSWPNTERLSYALGDTVRFRVINTSGAVHPMHLHGFYFDVGSRGDGTVDSVYSHDTPPYRVVTERAPPGRTFTMTWVPDRAGNWLFHCHDNFHVLRNAPLDGTPLVAEHKVHAANHAQEMMGGLVMAIEVHARGAAGAPRADGPRRHLRLVAQVDSGGTELEPSYGYVLHDGSRRSPVAPPLLPGPTIILKRGEPVSIMVVNHLAEPTAVHWHGMELESYFDGVADFAGSGAHIAHAIAPNDSFDARFTPPRSGTFMYHPHADEVRQQQAGMSGTLLVVDDPAAFDPVHDVVVMLSVPRADTDSKVVLVNGSLHPAPLELKTGERYRLRFVDIHTFRPSMVVRVLRDSSLVSWRAIAKDGMDLPAQRATARPTIQQMGNGETYDFEFIPAAAGDLRLTVSSAVGALLASMPIHVR
jgi:FtsP/CotA-like multicopper oxidase with cupredoxin domain